jgi:hypothetical protein
MRNTGEILRQKRLLGRPHRAIATSAGVSVGAVSLASSRASVAELSWELVESLAEEELERPLYPTAASKPRGPEAD